MRDIIWTLIGIWLIYKLVDFFKGLSGKNPPSGNHIKNQGNSTASTSKKDIHDAVQKHLNKEGEYVDFEEIK